LRTRLALTISLLIVSVGAVAFLAVDRATRAELEGRTDDELEEQYAEFDRQVADADPRDRSALQRVARGFLRSQRYHAESRIFAIEVGTDHPVSNHPELIEAAGDEEPGEARQPLFGAPAGFANVSTEETGELRVLSEPISIGAKRAGTFQVADPLESLSEAQEGLRNAFLLVGLLAVAVAVAAAVLAANRITAPLRGMSHAAADVDAGDLSPRFKVDTGDEVEQLAHSFNRMLDRLEHAFERERGLVSDASHELRTPLTVLRGQVELLARVGDDPEQRRKIAAALDREIARMTRLVDEMLTLARADDGRLLEPRRIELADFIADLERDLPLLGNRDYVIEADRRGVIVADPDRLSQVFRNLIRNAVEHTEPGGRIGVAARGGAGEIEFSVTDGGPGIPPQELPHVFERFHRVDAGRSRAEGGSGLGLAIARAIVEAHGGRIWAESAPGAGATFRFVLPGYEA
jgi:heavy metal sensor kinase